MYRIEGYKMLPLRHRISVVLWVVWLVWAILIVITLVEPYAKAKRESYPLLPQSSPQATFTVPVTVVEAYKLGRMTEQEKHEFETDLRSGQIGLPLGMTLVLPPLYPEPKGTLANLAFLVLLPGLGVTLIQYLLVGFASPLQLFKPCKTYA